MLNLFFNSFYLFAFLIYLVVPFAKHRHVMLLLMLAGSTLYGTAFYFQGALAGAMSCVVVNIFILMNVAIPEKNLGATFRLRLFILSCATVFFGAYSIRSAADILPFMSMMGARFAEALSDPEKIRVGYLMTLCIWIAYVATTGNYFFLALDLLRLASFLRAMWLGRSKAPFSGAVGKI